MAANINNNTTLSLEDVSCDIEYNTTSTSNPNYYIGNKGYTIYKRALTPKLIDDLKNELTVAPYAPMNNVKPPKFPVYRESKDKLYIPRFFGIDKYGNPYINKLTPGENISLEFAGDIREYQSNIINKFINNVDKNKSGGLLEIPCGRGKTVMALNIISRLKKKTLVIVHKSFLLNQWVERIEQFLPGARIGCIQGQKIDIENKDIVIGMLQSISMKDYPADTFDCFGLTIIDEVHHIAAEVFVRSLFKIVSPVMLGLSATMNRKDGLSYVFKMFIGPVIYKEKRETDDNVLVKCYQYCSTDEDFNDVVYNFKGQPQYSTMISKLCTHIPRCEYIINIITELVKNDTDNKEQIIVLAHNKNVLTYIYNAVDERKIADVGYYMGGMKENHLKESEGKKIVIGTYSMASEALDIKTLTTLIMVTPKTDIEQSVGRILRTKHSQPCVIDIVDQHDVFKRQYDKRLKFYRKNNYKVIESYDSIAWNTIYEPNTSNTSNKDKHKNKNNEENKKCKISSSSIYLENIISKYSNSNKHNKNSNDYEIQDSKHGVSSKKCIIDLNKI
jgi:superfamily II DNA or RNA helicase